MPAKQQVPVLPEPPADRPHTLTLADRRSLSLTGVQRIISCDETGALFQTPQGNLTVGGQEIRVGELSVRTGEVQLTGRIEYLQYTENRESAGGAFSRLFR